MKKNILILLALGATIWLASCSKNKENLVPAPSISIDTTFNYVDADGNPGVFSKKGDVVIVTDSVLNLTFDLFLNAGAKIEQVDIQFGGGAVTKLSTGVFFPLGLKDLKDTIKQDAQLNIYKQALGYTFNWIHLNQNGGYYSAFKALNSSNQSYTRIINDVEGWWPNVSYNGGFDSANSSVMTIVVPKAKGEVILNAIIHDETGKQGYLTKKIVVQN